MNRDRKIKLFLVRHGNTFEKGATSLQVGMRTDLPLTEQGRHQAKQFAAYMEAAAIQPKAIYAGSLRRQVEAATIVGEELGIQDAVHIGEPALNEIDYGLWEGLTHEQIIADWPEEYKGWTQQALWAERVFEGTLEEHLKMIKAWLKMLCRRYSARDTVVGFTSNGVIRLFYSFQQDAWNKMIDGKKMDTLKVKTGAFCELSITPDTLEVHRWNVTL